MTIPAPALCRGCGCRLTAVYPGQELHPLCDPHPQGWTDDQIAEWTERAAARTRQETP